MCHLDAVPEVEDQFPQVLVRGSDHRGPEEHVGEDTGLLAQVVLVPPVVLVQPQAEFLNGDNSILSENHCYGFFLKYK